MTTVACEKEEELVDVDVYVRNPLLIPEILSQIFGYFGPDALRVFRLVSKCWNSQSTHILTKTIFLVELSNKRELSKFIQIIQNDMFIEFTTFTFHLYRNFEMSDRGILNFLVMYGSKIRHLKVRNLFIKGSRDIEKLFILLSYFCPNLESLGLYCAYCGLSRCPRSELIYCNAMFEKLTSFVFENHNMEWKYLTQVFSCMPNLVCFEFINNHISVTSQSNISQVDQSLSSIIDIIWEAHQMGNLRRLATLLFPSVRPEVQSNEDFMKLQKMNIKLKRFESTVGSNVEQIKILQFLQQQSTNLQALSIRMDVSSNVMTTFLSPRMENLTILEIHITMFGFEILDSLPKLSALFIHCHVKTNAVASQVFSKIIETGSKIYPNLAALKLPLQSPKLAKLFIQKLPNLKSLEIGCTDEVLQYIYQGSQELEELKILSANNLTEKGFLGVSRQELFPNVEFGNLNMDLESREQIQSELWSRPFIGYLKKLRRLEIRQFAHTELTTLNILSRRFESNLSFFFGISSLKNLSTITLKTLVTKQSVLCLARLSSLKKVYAVPVVIGRGGYLGRSDLPTTAHWFQLLQREKPDLDIFVTTRSTKEEIEKGHTTYFTRRLRLCDVYKGMSTCTGSDVYLDKTSEYLADANLVKKSYKYDTISKVSKQRSRCCIT